MAVSSLTLATDSLELELCPAVGGSIARFDWTGGNGGRAPILRECSGPLDDVLEAASFPLVPFVNRIRGGAFAFRGREVSLSPNLAGDPCPLHGQGWTSAWQVESCSESEAALAFEHEPGEWPWAYEARQAFRLSANALHMSLSCRNASSEAMPCGLGFHPYFHCGPDTRIQTHVEEVWTVDDDVLPVERVAPAGRYSISDDLVCGRGLDNGYGCWSGRALLTDPGWPFEVELWSPQARFFQFYSPSEGGIFVAEPVSHANAALNEPEPQWAALGIRILLPGDSITLQARIAVQPHESALVDTPQSARI